MAALVLGPARAPLPRGPDVRGHPGRPAAALRRASPSTCSRTSSTTGAPARAPTSRSPSAAPSRARSRTASRRSRRSTTTSPARAAQGEAVVRRERRRRRPQVLPQRARQGRRRVPGAVHGPRQRVPRRRRRATYSGLPAIERLKWHLVRRRMLPELLEVLRFQREDLRDTPPVRIRGAWYADHPFRTDRSLRIPRGCSGSTRSWSSPPGSSASAGRTGGSASRAGRSSPASARAAHAQRVSLTALPPGRLRSVRLRAARAAPARGAVPRPDRPGRRAARSVRHQLGGVRRDARPAPAALGGRWRDSAGTST